MDFAYTLNGGAPTIKKFQVGADLSTVGIPVLVGGAANDGLVAAGTSAASDCVGITQDTATLISAQQSDNSDTAALVSVCISPDAVYKARLLGGATANTALTKYPITSASSDGLTITTTAAWDSPEFADGTLWGYDGANSGVARKITSTSGSVATLLVPVPFDTVVGDNFLRIPYTPGEDQFVQLSTNLDHLNASVLVDTDNANFRVIELDLNDISEEGDGNSFAFLCIFDSLYASGGSI